MLYFIHDGIVCGPPSPIIWADGMGSIATTCGLRDTGELMSCPGYCHIVRVGDFCFN